MGYHLFGNTEQSHIHHGRVSEHDKEVYGKIEEMEWLGSYETLEEAEKEQDKLFNKYLTKEVKKMTKQSQCQKIRVLLADKKWHSNIEIFQKCNCWRTGARIENIENNEFMT